MARRENDSAVGAVTIYISYTVTLKNEHVTDGLKVTNGPVKL